MAASVSTAIDVRLDVFGNANMDDTIDENDIDYVKAIINGSAPSTILADANYDQMIDEKDIDQIDLIIRGEEKSLTFLDLFGEAETINKPIEHVASLGHIGAQLLRLIGAEDKLLPVVGSSKSKYPKFWGDLSTYHAAGIPPDVDYEYLISLNPDAVQTTLEMNNYISDEGRAQKKEYQDKLPGIPLISLNAREPENISRSILIFGYLFDRKEEAREFASWHDGVYDKLKNITDHIPEEDKPKVLFNSHKAGYAYTAGGSRYGQAVRLAGGRNLIDDVVKSDSPLYGRTNVEVEPEWVIKSNPSYIISSYLDPNSTAGFETDDISGAQMTVDMILNTKELGQVDAIKNNNVYYIDNYLVGGGGLNLVGAVFLGKLWHPEEFKDIDPMEILQEYMNFYDSDFDVADDTGVFLYPPLK
jgi:iron complex transport system substrate-binding protein